MSRGVPILNHIRSCHNPEAVAGMARYGINPHNNFGVSVRELRTMAKSIGRDHELARELWDSGIHDARILACIIDEPGKVTEEQMERWAGDFDSWDVCDQVCNNLFYRAPFAYVKAAAWSGREETFVKRAGFVPIASLSVHDKRATDKAFAGFLEIIKREAADERNFVKKAINWALRQIGKRNGALHESALRLAGELRAAPSKAARWVGSDAWRELTSEKVLKRLAAL